MAIAASKIAGGGSALATTTCAFTAQAAGTWLVLHVSCDDYRATSGTGRPESTGWTLAASGQDEIGFYVWTKVADGSETSVQYKIGSGSPSAWQVLAVTGAAGTLVNSPTGTHSHGGSSTSSGSATAPAGNGYALALCSAYHSSSTITGASWANSYATVGTQNGPTTGNKEVVAAAGLATTTAASTSTTATWTGSSQLCSFGALLVFSEAAGGGPTEPSHGAATGTLSWVGTAVGRRVSAGAAAAVLAFTGTAVGHAEHHGDAVGTLSWVGQAAGSTEHHGAASGSLSWTGEATGHAPTVGEAHGAATGTLSWTGTASGSRASHGAATGSLAWAGTATGHAPTVGEAHGSATGTLSWSGISSGSRRSAGTATGSLSWTGTATGHAPSVDGAHGSATGALTWTGTATGRTRHRGDAAGTLAWTGVSAGYTRHRGGASGALTWTGEARGGDLSARDVTFLGFDERQRLVTFAERTRTVTYTERQRAITFQEDHMQLHPAGVEYYDPGPSSDPAVSDWLMSFDGGATKKGPTRVDDGRPKWLVAGPQADSPPADATGLPLGYTTPLLYAEDDPEVIVRSAPDINVTPYAA